MLYVKIEFDKDEKTLKTTERKKLDSLNYDITHKDGYGCQIQRHGKKGIVVIDTRYK